MGQSRFYSQTAYEGIKKLILDGHIPLGGVVEETVLAEYFGMSRTPIREAVKRLVAEGILKDCGGRLILPALSPKEVRNIYEIREAMELAACRRADGRQGICQIREGGSIDEILHADEEFHARLMAMADNELAGRMVAQMNLRLGQYFRVELADHFPAEECRRQLAGMAACLEAGDRDGLAQQMQLHLRWSRDLVLKHML